MTGMIATGAPAKARANARTRRPTKVSAGDNPASQAIADAPADQTAVDRTTKADTLITLLQRPCGATITQMCEAVGWLPHSVRGFMAGTLRKRHGITVVSEKTDAGRVYRAGSEGSGS